MTYPGEKQQIKDNVRQHVHELADDADWMHLTIEQRKQYYETWTNDPLIGGLLSKVMPASRVRVYLKDTIMKTYSRAQRPEIEALLVTMSISCESITRRYVKPQAILCGLNCLYSLAAAKDWKVAIMSAFERGQEIGTLRRNVVYMTEHTRGRFVDEPYRTLIETAAERLDVTVEWLT